MPETGHNNPFWPFNGVFGFARTGRLVAQQFDSTTLVLDPLVVFARNDALVGISALDPERPMVELSSILGRNPD